MRVEVYVNLHKQCLSVRALEGPNKGRVIAHRDGVVLKDCKFAVQPAGREKVRREKKKTVHAFVRGTLAEQDPFPDTTFSEFTYNPYRDETFVDKNNGQALTRAGWAWLYKTPETKGMFYR